MKEHPIIFSTEMVKAILDNCKTQTRRVIKETILTIHDNHKRYWINKGIAKYEDGSFQPYGEWVDCPYGQVGDRLWVRETWYSTSDKKELLGYVADGDFPHGKAYRIRPSIFMYRKFSRITLEITDIRVQRVQEISEEDALAEGITVMQGTHQAIDYKHLKLIGEPEPFTARYHYSALWDNLNLGRGYSWESNPWIWVITFKVIKES